ISIDEAGDLNIQSGVLSMSNLKIFKVSGSTFVGCEVAGAFFGTKTRDNILIKAFFRMLSRRSQHERPCGHTRACVACNGLAGHRLALVVIKDAARAYRLMRRGRMDHEMGRSLMW